MNHLTNLYKHKCEQLQEQIYCLTRMLNEVNAPLPTQGNPSVVPPNGIDPGMFNPRLIPRYERPNRDPTKPVPGIPSANPPKNPFDPDNPFDGSIWHDTSGNTWIYRDGSWRCIESSNDLPPVGTSYNPYNGRVYPPGHSSTGHGSWSDWWGEEFGQQTPGQALDDLWRQLFGNYPWESPNTTPPTEENPLQL